MGPVYVIVLIANCQQDRHPAGQLSVMQSIWATEQHPASVYSCDIRQQIYPDRHA